MLKVKTKILKVLLFFYLTISVAMVFSQKVSIDQK